MDKVEYAMTRESGYDEPEPDLETNHRCRSEYPTCQALHDQDPP